jgi:hypothetical protein
MEEIIIGSIGFEKGSILESIDPFSFDNPVKS